MSVEKKEVWVLRGKKYECWEEGSMSAERKEVWVLRGRKYECWVEGSMSVDSTRNEERCNIGNFFPHLDMSIIGAVQILAYALHRCNIFKSYYYQNTYPCIWTDYLLLQKAGSYSNLLIKMNLPELK